MYYHRRRANFFAKEAGIFCQKVSFSVLIGPSLALVKAFMHPPGEIHRGYHAAGWALGRDQLPIS